MSDDYRENHEEYWDDVYYFENFYKENDPNETSGFSGSKVGGSFWALLIINVIAAYISSSFGSVVLTVGIVIWILGKIFK